MRQGIIITSGPPDWTVLQQHGGFASIYLAGMIRVPDNCPQAAVKPLVRLVSEETNELVVPWKPCQVEYGNTVTWHVELDRVPAGGLYRLDSCGWLGDGDLDWTLRGDMIHHLGVGDVFAIAGQSNAVGCAREPIFDPPEAGVHLYRGSSGWDLASHPLADPTGLDNSISTESFNPGHSPWLATAKFWQRNRHVPVGLIQTALGGCPLSRWNPDEDGDLFRNFLKMVRDSKAGGLAGVLWYQGCSDTNAGLAPDYLERFARFVQAARSSLSQPDLPFITIQLNRYTAVAGATKPEQAENILTQNIYWGVIREAQRRAALQIPNVLTVPSTDASLSDSVHLSSAGNLVVGERAGRALLTWTLEHKKLAPDISRITRFSESEIDLHFLNMHRFVNVIEIAGSQSPFRLQAGSAAAPADGGKLYTPVEAKLVEPAILRLRFNTAIPPEAVIHGGWQLNPCGTAPVDSVTKVPMLSFFGVPVE